MAKLVPGAVLLNGETAEIGRSIISSFRHHTSSFRSASAEEVDDDNDDEIALQWAAIERLPTLNRIRSSLFDHSDGELSGKRLIDVTEISAVERHCFIDKLIKNVEEDNLRLLEKLRERMRKVDVKLPTVEVRYKNLSVEARCELLHGKPLPTLWNTISSTLKGFTRICGFKSQEASICILKYVSGIIKPSSEVKGDMQALGLKKAAFGLL